MAVYLDDQPIILPGDDLASVLDAAQEHLTSRGRIVVEVILNGQTLLDDQLAQYADEPIHQSEIRLVTADPVDLAVTTLNQACQALDEARTLGAHAAELCQQDQGGKAIAEISKVISIWQQVGQAVTHCTQLAGVNLDHRTFEDQPVTELINSLGDRLKELRDLLQDTDVLGLADAMTYEWPQALDRWQNFIALLMDWVQEPQTPES